MSTTGVDIVCVCLLYFVVAFIARAMTVALQQLLISHGFVGTSVRLEAVAAACESAGLDSLADFDGVESISELKAFRPLSASEVALMVSIVAFATTSAAGFGEAMVHAVDSTAFAASCFVAVPDIVAPSLATVRSAANIVVIRRARTLLPAAIARGRPSAPVLGPMRVATQLGAQSDAAGSRSPWCETQSAGAEHYR